MNERRGTTTATRSREWGGSRPRRAIRGGVTDAGGAAPAGGAPADDATERGGGDAAERGGDE